MTRLASGKRIAADAVMYSAGRQGQTDALNLSAAGLSADSRGRIAVDDQYRTQVPHIFAVGDVIGFPALAATSMDQGRLAAYHAFDEPARELQAVQPIGIYTIPEISYCGRTEEELTTSAVPYEVGVARYRELARGQIVGDSYGMLKLLVHTETRELLGVHIFGTLRHRPRAHRPGDHGVRRDRRLPRRHRPELPDAVRGVQGGRPGRDEQDPPGRAVQPVTRRRASPGRLGAQPGHRPADAARQGDEGAPDVVVELDPSVAAAAADLHVGDDLLLLTWFHLADRTTLAVHPRGDATRP